MHNLIRQRPPRSRATAPYLLLVASLGALVGASTSCRKIFERPAPMVERSNPTVPAGRYRALTTIAGGGESQIDIQISATVRSQLTDSGFTVVRRAGRWSDERSALRAICAPEAIPSVDGVVFVWYDKLELRDCRSEAVAYEIRGSANHGITDMTGRLIRYLRRPVAGEQRSP